MVVATGVASVLGFVGYAFASSWAAWTKNPKINPQHIGWETFFFTGALGVAGAFFFTAFQS
jgi:hypothetical protein